MLLSLRENPKEVRVIVYREKIAIYYHLFLDHRIEACSTFFLTECFSDAFTLVNIHYLATGINSLDDDCIKEIEESPMWSIDRRNLKHITPGMLVIPKWGFGDTERIDKETGDLDKVLDCIELEDRQVLSMADFAFL